MAIKCVYNVSGRWTVKTDKFTVRARGEWSIIDVQVFNSKCYIKAKIFLKSIFYLTSILTDFIISISLHPNAAGLRYFKLWILLMMKGSMFEISKVYTFKWKNQSLLPRLNSFASIWNCIILTFEKSLKVQILILHR